ncbi:MAG: hypothetical protein IIA14_01820 [SAR324 cluster bacterium]|nr:hypothetical protein [SAR324 cluster bacterium]
MTPMKKLLVFAFVLAMAAFALNGCMVEEEKNATGPGSAASPLLIPPGSTGGGVGNFQSVHYTVTLTPGTWNITLSLMTSDADLRVYNNNAFVGPICVSDNPSTLSESCPITVPFTAAYYIRVSAFGFETTSFLLHITLAPPPAGSISNPIPIGTGTTAGSVNSGQNVYYVTTLTPMPATITLTGLTADADLYVYSNSGFTALVCSSIIFGTANESCMIPVGPPASFYIRVAGFSGSTSYNLGVANP